jgi:hypothetical protein
MKANKLSLKTKEIIVFLKGKNNFDILTLNAENFRGKKKEIIQLYGSEKLQASLEQAICKL